MAASVSLVVLAGRRLRLKRAAALQESMDLGAAGPGPWPAPDAARRDRDAPRRRARSACGSSGVVGPDVPRPGFAALFHAVSAFCNAGFSTFATGLRPFRDDLATNAVIATLIVVGGLGFPVLRSLGHALAEPGRDARVPRLTLHARLALLTTASS